jgi:flavin-dependent dehydrogenase
MRCDVAIVGGGPGGTTLASLLKKYSPSLDVCIFDDGPVIATWVEGIQVVQWEDTRKPDDNPRKVALLGGEFLPIPAISIVQP